MAAQDSMRDSFEKAEYQAGYKKARGEAIEAASGLVAFAAMFMNEEAEKAFDAWDKFLEKHNGA